MDKKNKNNIAKILLAFGVLASPMMLANQVSADNSIANTTNTNNIESKTESDAVTTDNVINENKEEKEVVTTAAENNKAEATKEATTTENTAIEATETTTKAEEKSNENSDVVQNKKEVDFKLDASQRHELKEAGYTDVEINAIEKEIAIKKAENPDFNVNEFVASKVNDKKAETEKQNKEANELGISDEIIGEKVSTNSTTGNDLSNKVTDSKITITTPNNKEAKKIKPIEGVANDDYDTLLNANVEFNVPKKTVENDYIDIDLSNNVSVNGLIEDFNPGALDSYYGPDLIAKADYDKVEKKLRYTFTKDVEKYGNVKVRTEFPLFIDKQVVTANGDQKVEVSVGNKTESKTYNIDYLPKNFGGTTKKINGKEVPDLVSNGYADISNVNFKKGTYDHVIYVNPKEMPQKGTLVQLTNMQGTNGVIFDKDVLNNAKLYVVKDLRKLSPSFHLDPENLTEVNANDYIKTLDKANNTITFELPNKTFDNPNKKDKIEGHSGLVISYEGKLNGTSTDDNFGTHVVFDNGRSNGGEKDYFTWDNQIYKATGNSDATGNKDVGRFEEFHVYQTVKSDGSITTDDYEYGNFQEGSADETYKTAKKDREGYTLVRVRSENDAKFDSKGAETTGNFVPGETLRVRYLYQKKEAAQTGSFQEHHIYISKDKDGKEISREEVPGDLQKGKEDESYTTGKKEKDHFKFVRTENPVNDPTVGENGEDTTGNYKPGVKQEITYVYERTETPWTPLTPAEENGSFQEHHVYEVYKDGKLVESSEITLEETTGTKEDYFTTSAKPNGTKDQPKEGFKLVKELIAKSVDVESHLTGGEIKEHYKNNEKLEVRYVYRKDITTPTTPETPWTPLEPSEPVTPVEPEEPTTPVVPDQPEEPTTPATPETPDEDPKETPWTPLTPAEEVTPQTPGDNETPKDEPKETPKEDSKETPKDEPKETPNEKPGKEDEPNRNEKENNAQNEPKKQSKKLPKAGADYELLQLAAGALTLVSGMGISLSRKKRD